MNADILKVNTTSKKDPRRMKLFVLVSAYHEEVLYYFMSGFSAYWVFQSFLLCISVIILWWLKPKFWSLHARVYSQSPAGAGLSGSHTRNFWEHRNLKRSSLWKAMARTMIFYRSCSRRKSMRKNKNWSRKKTSFSDF